MAGGDTVIYVLGEMLPGAIPRQPWPPWLSVKIGFTSKNTSANRQSDLQAGNPRGLVCVGEMEGTYLDEGNIHRALADYQRKGEWFLVPGAIMPPATTAAAWLAYIGAQELPAAISEEVFLAGTIYVHEVDGPMPWVWLDALDVLAGEALSLRALRQELPHLDEADLRDMEQEGLIRFRLTDRRWDLTPAGASFFGGFSADYQQVP